MSPSTNTRWCPTPEQLMILEELYRRGLKTPNASQIQKITAHLSFYGKIQGKNVFYWFQNHKARDRQKLRKKLAKQLHQQRFFQQHVYGQQYQLCLHDPQNQYNNINSTHITTTTTTPLDFQVPFQQLSNCYSPQNLHAQGSSGVYDEEAPELGLMRQISWRADLPKDPLIRSYGHDSTMIMDVGPTFPCCRINKPPLQTLELFPLRSAKDNQDSTSNNNNNNNNNNIFEPPTSYLDDPLIK